MDTLDLLMNEVESEFEKLKDLEPGSKEYEIMVNGITKLINMGVEIEKVDMDADEKEKTRLAEMELKLKQLEVDKKDKMIRNIISAAGVILPIGVTVWGTLKSFKFEEEGTITTIMGRGFINKLLPKK